MAWGGNTNPCTIGNTTQKVNYDDLWDKLQYIKDSVIPAATKMLFGQTSAPSGWTKDTATWTNNSMIVFTTGSIGSGGATSPSAAHVHGMNSHTHAITYNGWSYTSTDSSGRIRISSPGSNEQQATASQTSGAAAGSTAANTQPYYQTVIAATKDTYT